MTRSAATRAAIEGFDVHVDVGARSGRDGGSWSRAWRVAALAVALGAASCATFQRAPIDFGVPASSYYESPGRGRTFVLDRGEGPAILLIHGYGSAHVVYLRLIDRLVAAGYRVIAVDLPGFGLSDRREGDYSPEALAELLLEILDARGVGQVDVIAHSWGSSIALRLALDHPDRVRRLVLTSAWVYEEQLNPFIRWARARGVGEALYTLFYRERAADRYEMSWYAPELFVTQDAVDAVERMLSRPGTVRAALQAARQMRYGEVQRRYHEVGAESLLVWGRFDEVSPLEIGHRLEADLPNARLVVLDRCGHVPMIERAGAYEHEVLSFLGPAGADQAAAPAPEPQSEPEPGPAAAPAPVEPPNEPQPWGPPPPTGEEGVE
jgi:2-hydroxymuconate-semialdehyde hydrolase